MGLLNIVQNGVTTAFKTVGDLKTTITLTRTNNAQYDPVTDQITGGTVETVTVEAVEYKITEQEKRFLYPKTPNRVYVQRKVIIDPKDLGTYIPEDEDICTIKGRDYYVVQVNKPPEDVLYTLYLAITR